MCTGESAFESRRHGPEPAWCAGGSVLRRHAPAEPLPNRSGPEPAALFQEPFPSAVLVPATIRVAQRPQAGYALWVGGAREMSSGLRRIAAVTGAGSGVGRQSALALLGDGYHVALLGRRQAALEETADLSAAGDRCLVLPTDVTSETAVGAAFGQLIAAFGRLDVLFNNAGGNVPPAPVEDLTLEQWQSVVDVNLTGVFLCTREALRIMKRQQPMGGRIINNGSVSAHMPRPFSAPYTSTKHAVTGLTKQVALDGRASNVACGQIDIGNAATPMTARMAQGVLQADLSVAPEPRIDADHVARAVLYMANLPLDANVLTMTVMATKMPLVGRG